MSSSAAAAFVDHAVDTATRRVLGLSKEEQERRFASLPTDLQDLGLLYLQGLYEMHLAACGASPSLEYSDELAPAVEAMPLRSAPRSGHLRLVTACDVRRPLVAELAF